MSSLQTLLDARAARTGRSQVCPHSTHGQTLLGGSGTPVSLRMVDTALNDHGNLTPGVCELQIPDTERATGEAQDVLKPEGLTRDVQSDQNDGAKVVALRVTYKTPTPTHHSCPQKPLDSKPVRLLAGTSRILYLLSRVDV